MNNKKRKQIFLIILFTIIIILLIIGAVYTYIKDKKEYEKNNQNGIANVENNSSNGVENNIDNTNQTNNTVEDNTNQINQNGTKTVDSKEEAIELVEQEIGENENVYVSFENRDDDGNYIISVRDKETTAALYWYTVNKETGFVEMQ